MTWLTIKAKLWAFAAAVVSVLLLILQNRWLRSQKERAEHRRDVAEAGLRRKHVTEDREAKIDKQTSERKRETPLDEVPDILSRPNDRE